MWAAMASYDAALYRFREALDRWSGGCMDDDFLKLLQGPGPLIRMRPFNRAFR